MSKKAGIQPTLVLIPEKDKSQIFLDDVLKDADHDDPCLLLVADGDPFLLIAFPGHTEKVAWASLKWPFLSEDEYSGLVYDNVERAIKDIMDDSDEHKVYSFVDMKDLYTYILENNML